MKTLFAFLLLCLLLPLAPAAAQDAPAAHLVAYVNDAQQVVSLNPATGEQAILLQTHSPSSAATAYGLSPSPDGQHLAVFVSWEEQREAAVSSTAMLYVLRVADGTLLLEQPLLPADYVHPGIDVGNPAFEMLRALGELAWSPNSRYLAYVSAQAGSADLWLLDTSDQSSRQLESSPAAAAYLHWSPDSRNLVFTEVESFGTGGGLNVAGSSIANVEEGSISVPQLDPRAQEFGFTLVGWQDERSFLYSPLEYSAGGDGFFAYHLDDHSITSLVPAQTPLVVPAYDAASNTALLISPDFEVAASLPPGLYAWDGSELNLVQEGSFYFVERARPGVFSVAAQDGTYVYENGALRPLPEAFYGAFISPQQDAVALYRADGLYISRLSADDSSLVWAGDAQIPVWSPDGVFFYSFGFTEGGAGLLQFDVLQRGYTLLDTRMAATSPVAVLPLP